MERAALGTRPRSKGASKNAPAFDLRRELYRITGIDWSQVNRMDVLTAQTVITEAGADLANFSSEMKFTSWLDYVPPTSRAEAKYCAARHAKL